MEEGPYPTYNGNGGAPSRMQVRRGGIPGWNILEYSSRFVGRGSSRGPRLPRIAGERVALLSFLCWERLEEPLIESGNRRAKSSQFHILQYYVTSLITQSHAHHPISTGF